MPFCKIAANIEYIVGDDGAGQCPRGADAMSETECRALPKWFGGSLHNPFVIGHANYPHGCIRWDGRFAYNIDPEGAAHLGRTPFCKRSSADVPFIIGDDGADGCPSGASAVSEAECRSAIKWFRGRLGTPFIVETAGEPPGCFSSQQQFFFNRHRAHSGRHGSTPYCKLPDPVEYVVGKVGDSQCPEDTVVLSEAECRGLPKQFGGRFGSPFVIHNPQDPKGCLRYDHLFKTHYFFNDVTSGAGRKGRTPYCGRKTASSQYVV